MVMMCFAYLRSYFKRGAWNENQGMLQEDAKLEYIKFVKKLKPDFEIDIVKHLKNEHIFEIYIFRTNQYMI